jgi:hypothetical protein
MEEWHIKSREKYLKLRLALILVVALFVDSLAAGWGRLLLLARLLLGRW